MDTKFQPGNLKGNYHLGELGADCRIKLKRNCEDVDWIHVPHDRFLWWALMKAIRKVWVP
jgi:hypothetical protein